MKQFPYNWSNQSGCELWALLTQPKWVTSTRIFHWRGFQKLLKVHPRLAAIVLIALRPNLINQPFEERRHIRAGRDVEALQALIAVEIH